MRPNGTSLDEKETLKPQLSEFKVGSLSPATLISASEMRGDPPYELIYEVLQGAGVYENYGTSRLIFDWLGDDGCDWLKTEYGENWECVAILEYCTVHFPSSALVTLAARIMVADFVSNNGFDAGYASRELIMLASGAEEVAILAINTRKRVGEAGARASRERSKTWSC